jgi:hypothetical protein
MERFLQYLDDLDDFVGALALAAERLRRAVKAMVVMAVSVGFQMFGIMLALSKPPLALAVVSLLTVGMLYRAAVHRPPTRASLTP